MTITKRSDGSVALDWSPPGGPFVILTVQQWAALLKEMRRFGL